MIRHELRPKQHPQNPIVFFDLAMSKRPLGRVKFELFKHLAPRTAENFRQFCTGEFRIDKVPVGYKNSRFHRVIKGFIIQGGDFLSGNGTGCMSIYGDAFADENLTIKHDTPGLLSMANSGPNTNGCQFFITCARADSLDDNHVVFGKVLDADSMAIIRKIENVSVGPGDAPKIEVVITECGEY